MMFTCYLSVVYRYAFQILVFEFTIFDRHGITRSMTMEAFFSPVSKCLVA